jgi:hypothetical protein
MKRLDPSLIMRPGGWNKISGRSMPMPTADAAMERMMYRQPTPLPAGKTFEGIPSQGSSGEQSSFQESIPPEQMMSVIGALRSMSDQESFAPMTFRTLGNVATPSYTAPKMRSNDMPSGTPSAPTPTSKG